MAECKDFYDSLLDNVREIDSVIESLPKVETVEIESVPASELVHNMWKVIKVTSKAHLDAMDYIIETTHGLKNESHLSEIDNIVHLVNTNLANMEARAQSMEDLLVRWLSVEGINSSVGCATVLSLAHKLLFLYVHTIRGAKASSRALYRQMKDNRHILDYKSQVNFYS